ncbi:hypothetical protein LOTGIDRAFT_174251 [Lottia gigantea]|uniref:EGF-like domain-containing protein n=1 Tax=Lottia gigantea TaxID=225164 RepID=V4A3N0_LOTGI|nr:hypothetical protein LOTGIDRAFT_174251 [Lottia gigantea]ESO98483.1 hypothetical protein LOTGIDRAFT_174251 [Lottia gigantea]
MGIGNEQHVAVAVFRTTRRLFCQSQHLTRITDRRHICQRDQIVMRPVRRPQTFCRPHYQRMIMPCPNNSNQLCNTFRFRCRIAQRSVLHMVPQREQSYSCCPGWAGYSPRYRGCMNPVCERKCENGGHCSKPGQCSCPNGWSGDCCQNDTNECKGEHECQQVCNNRPGGYNCSCFDGFTLQSDQKSCQFCLTCSNEYRNLEVENRRLKTEIDSMESQMSLLNRTVSSVTEKLTRLSQTVYLEDRTKIANNAHNTDVQDALVTLSERVGELEESNGNCFCSSEIARAQNDVYKEFKRMEKDLDTRISLLEFEQIEPPPSFRPPWIDPTVFTPSENVESKKPASP